ncbi:DNA-3-methyladenine glycosylase [Xanthobacteraceae bacterium A53D]
MTIDFKLDAVEAAQRLIGVTFLVDGVGGTIVETEAYEQDDPASHSFRGLTKTNRAMFGPPGRAYVYRSYGLHWCFNIVTRNHGAVLIRALAPTHEPHIMQARRASNRHLCNGPGRLTQALGISGIHDELPLDGPPFTLIERSEVPVIIAGPRIGITKAAERPWRFGLKDSAFLSRPFPAVPRGTINLRRELDGHTNRRSRSSGPDAD